MRISDWSSDVCSSDLVTAVIRPSCVKLRFGRHLATGKFIDLLEPRQIRLRLRYGRLSLSNACFCCSQSGPALIDGIDQAGRVAARKDLPFGDTVIPVHIDVRAWARFFRNHVSLIDGFELAWG